MPVRALAAAVAALCLLGWPAAAAPARVVDAIIHVESGGNPDARGRHGEIGLMQIKCRTARSVGFRGPCARLYDHALNRRYGTAYLDLCIARAGNLWDGVSRYQRGAYARVTGCTDYCRRVKRAMR